MDHNKPMARKAASGRPGAPPPARSSRNVFKEGIAQCHVGIGDSCMVRRVGVRVKGLVKWTCGGRTW